jgi:hypothetical protein
MNTHASLQALHRANPRSGDDLGPSIEAVRAQIGTPGQGDVRTVRSTRRRRVAGTLAGVSVAAVTGIAVALVGFGTQAGSIEDAAAAVRQAVALTAASAERSGAVHVRITHDDAVWAAKTLTWNGNDMSVADTWPSRGNEMRVVDGILYFPDPEEADGWLRLGSPSSIDPDSGTTPAEYLAAVREDVGGTTLRRLTREVSGLTTRTLDDGSTVYSGRVAAGQVARETGFKEGEAIRVLPFGYVAHDEAADPASLLNVAITVDPDGVVRELAVTWGTWLYTVVYSGLGVTPAPPVPPNVHNLKRHVGSD